MPIPESCRAKKATKTLVPAHFDNFIACVLSVFVTANYSPPPAINHLSDNHLPPNYPIKTKSRVFDCALEELSLVKNYTHRKHTTQGLSKKNKTFTRLKKVPKTRKFKAFNFPRVRIVTWWRPWGTRSNGEKKKRRGPLFVELGLSDCSMIIVGRAIIG